MEKQIIKGVDMTEYLEDAAELADNVILMKHGEVVRELHTDQPERFVERYTRLLDHIGIFFELLSDVDKDGNVWALLFKGLGDNCLKVRLPNYRKIWEAKDHYLIPKAVV